MGLYEPKELFNAAEKGHFALGAFNVFSMESLQAVLEASEKMQAPAIVQVSMGARKYVKDFPLFVRLIKMYAESSDAAVFIQHDHCQSVENCKEAVDAGVQAVMFDGSSLSYEENIRKTKEVAAYAHDKGVWVEAELGRIPGFEDTVFSGHAEYTDPEAASAFITETGCDALAVSVGTSHGGVIADRNLPIDFKRLDEIIAAVPGYPFVLHGGASLPEGLIEECNREGACIPGWKMCTESDISRAVTSGIRKVNMDVDNFLVATTEIRRFFNTKPEVYDIRKYLRSAYDAFEKEVEHKFKEVLHSAGGWKK